MQCGYLRGARVSDYGIGNRYVDVVGGLVHVLYINITIFMSTLGGVTH